MADIQTNGQRCHKISESPFILLCAYTATRARLLRGRSLYIQIPTVGGGGGELSAFARNTFVYVSTYESEPEYKCSVGTGFWKQ